MSLLDQARSVQVRKGPPCRISVIRDAASPALRAEIDELFVAVRNKEVFGSVAAAVLREHDLSVDPGSMRRHIGGLCRCP